MFNGKIHHKWPFSIAMLVHQRVESTARSGNFSWNNQAFFREDSANPVPIIYAVVAVTLLYFAQMNRIFPQETPWPRLLHPYRHCWKKNNNDYKLLVYMLWLIYMFPWNLTIWLFNPSKKYPLSTCLPNMLCWVSGRCHKAAGKITC
jgi:hypothetical protein